MSGKTELVTELLKDDDIRKFAIDTAKDSYTTSRNIIQDSYATGKKILKLSGIALLAGLAVWGIYKGVSVYMEKRQQKESLDEYTEDMDKQNLSYKKNDYKVWAEKLYKIGFDQASLSWTYCNYDEDVIRKILKSLKTPDDWKYLVEVFGTKEAKKGEGKGQMLNLPDFLSLDDDSPEYQQILESIGVNIQL